VEGTPEVRSFTRNDGTPGASLSMRVRDVQLLGRKGDSNSGGSSYGNESSTTRQEAPASVDEVADDLPF